MQQFTVPQFIDVEDKIIGPITTRQFLIMLVCFILMAIFYKLFDFSLFITASVIDFAISGVIAFAKINGRPFHYFILNIVQTMKRPRLRVWDNARGKTDADFAFEEIKKAETASFVAPKRYTSSRLAELSLVVDTGGAFQGGKDDKILTENYGS